MIRIAILLFLCSSLSAKTICLNMIVKNERGVIERCLASVKPYIDYWVIVDTGSTDGTQEAIRAFLKDVPGELYERPWVNFAHNRNEALQLADGKEDYSLIIDADEALSMKTPLSKESLDKPCYTIEVVTRGDKRSHRIFLIDRNLDWTWEGVIHESLVCPEAKKHTVLAGARIDATPQDGNRSKDPDKHAKDALVLEKALEEEPNNARYVYYLAQSYFNAKNYPKALENYLKRAEMGGWAQERFWSMYRAATVYDITNAPLDVVILHYVQAYQFRPTRAEPLIRLVQHLKNKGIYLLGFLLSEYAWELPLPKDSVNVESWIYEFGALQEVAECAFLIGRYELAKGLFEELLALPTLPKELKAIAENNYRCTLQKQTCPPQIR